MPSSGSWSLSNEKTSPISVTAKSYMLRLPPISTVCLPVCRSTRCSALHTPSRWQGPKFSKLGSSCVSLSLSTSDRSPSRSRLSGDPWLSPTRPQFAVGPTAQAVGPMLFHGAQELRDQRDRGCLTTRVRLNPPETRVGPRRAPPETGGAALHRGLVLLLELGSDARELGLSFRDGFALHARGIERGRSNQMP